MIHTAIRAERRAKKRKALLNGLAGQLAPIEEELLRFIFEKHEQGINMKHMLVACRASGMLRQTFDPKSINAKVKARPYVHLRMPGCRVDGQALYARPAPT